MRKGTCAFPLMVKGKVAQCCYGLMRPCNGLSWDIFLTNSTLLMKEHTGAVAWLQSLLHKISACSLTWCEMILSVCIITWKLSGVHINIYLHSCFPQGAPGVTSVHMRRLGGALRESCQALSLDSHQPPQCSIRSVWGYVSFNSLGGKFYLFQPLLNVGVLNVPFWRAWNVLYIFSEFNVEREKSSGIYACELQTSQFLFCQQKAILKLLELQVLQVLCALNA